MNTKPRTHGRSLKGTQMYELAEELGMTLEELVGPKRAVLYPRNKFEVEFRTALQRATPQQRAVLNALIVGTTLGFIDTAGLNSLAASPDPLNAALAWCDTLTPAQRAAMEERAADDDARMARKFADAKAAA